MMACCCGKPLVLHEQNSIAGMANKVLARRGRSRASRPSRNVLQARRSGSAIRCAPAFLRSRARRALRRPQRAAAPAGGRRQPGRQGAERIVPQALALIAAATAAAVTHQTGASRSTSCAPTTPPPASQAELTPFIDDMAQRLCRGRPDRLPRRRDHRHRARGRRRARRCWCRSSPWTTTRPPTRQRSWMATQAAAGSCRKRDLTPQWLADLLQQTERAELHCRAMAAKARA